MSENSKELNKKDMQETKGGIAVDGPQKLTGPKGDGTNLVIDLPIAADELKSDSDDPGVQMESRK